MSEGSKRPEKIAAADKEKQVIHIIGIQQTQRVITCHLHFNESLIMKLKPTQQVIHIFWIKGFELLLVPYIMSLLFKD